MFFFFFWVNALALMNEFDTFTFLFLRGILMYRTSLEITRW